MTTTLNAGPEIADFARHLRLSDPFQSNRVSDAGGSLPPSVDALHKAEFEQLCDLVALVRGHNGGIGALLWGEPGIGKTHLLNRLRRVFLDKACVVTLHNVQASPERLSRYVLNSVVRQLARCQKGGLRDGRLSFLIAGAVQQLFGATNSRTMADAEMTFRNKFVKPAVEGGAAQQEFAYEVLFSYFRTIYHYRWEESPSPFAAELALRWLAGDELDPQEIDELQLPQDVARRISRSLPDGDAVNGVLAAISRLADDAGQAVMLIFDQVDNLSDEQVSAWASFAHVLLDRIPNLLVITSGVKGRLVEMNQSNLVNEANWHRIAQERIDLHHITPVEAWAILETRLEAFVEPYLDSPEIKDRVSDDSLFPLGTAWLEDRIGNAVDVRPRDVINWAHERIRNLAREIRETNPEEWLANWTGQDRTSQSSAAPATIEERQKLVDDKIDTKLAEQRRRRQLNPESLPADSDNLLGLVEQLLIPCLDPRRDYSLKRVSRSETSKRGPKPTYDLIVKEQSPDGQIVTTGVKFVSTGSKQSAAATLKRLVKDNQPPNHTLIVTDERCPLQLGRIGSEKLAELEVRGEATFGCRELSLDSLVQLDALQSLIGQARSGDLEVTFVGGKSEPITPEEVIESYHRNDRFRQHDFLRELLTEEAPSAVATRSTAIEEQAVDVELNQFIMSQIALTSGMSTRELADKYESDRGLGEGEVDAVRTQIENAVAAMHKAGKVWATPQDEYTFVSLSELPTTEPVSELALCDVTTPVQFTVSQVRQAAACPRLLHLDAEHTRSHKLNTPRVTQIWQATDPSDVGALGTLFHQAVESFNDKAPKLKPLSRLLSRRPTATELRNKLHELILNSVTKGQKWTSASKQQRANFNAALTIYASELSDVLFAGLRRAKSTDDLVDQMFGDRRKEVDATFEVGLGERPIRVVGRLDYIFHDWRSDTRRILDYKLTPSNSVDADLFQICIYALLHHEKYGTNPDVALLYLHPERKMVELSWQEVETRRHEIYDLLASMVEWERFQSEPPQGLRPPGNAAYCTKCRYEKTCTSRLGMVDFGDRLTQWKDADIVDSTKQPLLEEIESAPTNMNAGPNAQKGGTAKSLNKSSDSLYLGVCISGKAVELPLQKIASHVALVGASGSGKTWMAKIIAEEAIRLGLPIVAIDPQGDIVQFLQKTKEKLPKHHSVAHDEYWSRVEPRVFTPGTSHGRRLTINPIRLPSFAALDVGDNHKHQEMLNATVMNLVNFAGAGGNVAMQQTFLLQLIRHLLSKQRSDASEINLKDLAIGVMSPVEFGMEDPSIYLPNSQRIKLGQMIMTLLDGPKAHLFHGGEPLDIDVLLRPGTEGKTPLNVIYLNAMASDEEKQFFVAALATEMYRWMTTTLESSGRAKLLLYLDEARDFIPKGTCKPPAKDPLIRLFTQGRKYGLPCLICTQSPNSVDYNVFGNCSTKFIGRLASKQDVDTVAKWFSTDGTRPEWLSGRKEAPSGSFVARWPKMPSTLDGCEFRGRPLFSLHEGAWSPERVQREIELLKW